MSAFTRLKTALAEWMVAHAYRMHPAKHKLVLTVFDDGERCQRGREYHCQHPHWREAVLFLLDDTNPDWIKHHRAEITAALRGEGGE